jgi:hypothetical protein
MNSIQNGLINFPVASGEKGFTLNHIRASDRVMADFPSSKINSAPWIGFEEMMDSTRCVLLAGRLDVLTIILLDVRAVIESVFFIPFEEKNYISYVSI